MGSIMKNKIHTIEVENNETESVEKIIEKIRENKIIYVKNKFYQDKDVLDSITENGPAIILNSSGVLENRDNVFTILIILNYLQPHQVNG